MLLVLNTELKHCFPATRAGFEQFMGLKGDVYRALEGRRTQRITLGENTYFIKQHNGVGWKEIFKNLLQLRAPVISAKNEWRALQKLRELHIPAPEALGYGCRGMNPAARQSFIITRELAKNCSLEDVSKRWKQSPPVFSDKLKLIKEVARIARILHVNGVNHRDFYLCHFLLDLSVPIRSGPRLYLIDLHRAGLRKRVPERWAVKDLAGLYFSSKSAGLTARDLFRFMKAYRDQPLSDVIKKETPFWRKVRQRGDKLCKQHE